MILARVLGSSWGTRRAQTLSGERMLVVRPLSARPRPGASGVLDQHNAVVEDGAGTLVVVDRLGAGPGELVLVAHGSRCRDLTLGPDVATKEMVVAIVDGAELSLEGRS